MRKKFLIIIVNIFLSNVFCFSHGAEMHYEFLKSILFGTNKTITFNDKELEKLKLLDFSSRVAIDQYNGNYIDELNFLQSKGIKTISSIKLIDFSGNSHHQRYTHRGWTFSYVTNTGNWGLRKKLILDTTKKIFSFDSNEQHDAFSALLYYVHILGDHDGDSISNTMDRIALGGRSDKLDILSELTNIYLPKLFKNQKKEVNSLCEKLISINNKCSKLLIRKGDGYDDRNVKRDVKDLSEPEYEIYISYAKETLKALAEYIPILLKNEKWFIKVFPSCK